MTIFLFMAAASVCVIGAIYLFNIGFIKTVREDQIDQVEMEKFESSYNIKALRIWYGINLITAGIYLFMFAFSVVFESSLLFLISTAVAVVFFVVSFLFRMLSPVFKNSGKRDKN